MKRKISYHWSGKKWVDAIVVGETRVSKEFCSEDGLSTQLYDGLVVGRRRDGQYYLYMIEYEDNDTEEMYASEVRKCMKTYQTRQMLHEKKSKK